MRNIFINDYRKKSRQNTVFDNTPNDFLLDHNQSSVSNMAESNLSLKEAKQAVESLPEIFKQPFVLYVEGYKYNEISAYLDEPLGTVKSRIHFARKLLKTELSRN
jgi:RNA polymerase sigma-70 factor (ECF subfamily)